MFTKTSKFLLSAALLLTMAFATTSCSTTRRFNASMGGGPNNDSHHVYGEDETSGGIISGIIVNGDGSISGGDISNGQVFYDRDGNQIIFTEDNIYVNGELLDERFTVVIDSDGEIFIAPRDDSAPETHEPEEEIETVRLPTGVLANKEDVTYLEDGTVVHRIQPSDNGFYEHTLYFPDGTIANTYYINSEYEQCNYADSMEIHVHYMDSQGTALKYEVYNTENLFLCNRTDYVYSQVEPGLPETPTYLSSIVKNYFSEDGTTAKTVEEYDYLHGPEKPYLKTYYDNDGKVINYYEYKYSLAGELEKETGCYPDGSIFWLKTYYSNGNLEYFLDAAEDGSVSELYYDENGLRTLYRYVYTHGGSRIIHYKNGIPSLGELEMPNGNYQQSFYDEEGVETRAVTYDSNGNMIQVETYEYNEPPAYSKIYIHNSNNVLIGLTEYISDENGWAHSIETSYYDNGNIKEIVERKDYVEIRRENYDINGNRLP